MQTGAGEQTLGLGAAARGAFGNLIAKDQFFKFVPTLGASVFINGHDNPCRRELVLFCIAAVPVWGVGQDLVSVSGLWTGIEDAGDQALGIGAAASGAYGGGVTGDHFFKFLLTLWALKVE
jgi:hypothetical protein